MGIIRDRHLSLLITSFTIVILFQVAFSQNLLLNSYNIETIPDPVNVVYEINFESKTITDSLILPIHPQTPLHLVQRYNLRDGKTMYSGHRSRAIL